MELIKCIHPKNSFTLCILYSVFIYYKVLSFKIFSAVSEKKKDRFHHLHIGNKDFSTKGVICLLKANQLLSSQAGQAQFC